MSLLSRRRNLLSNLLVNPFEITIDTTLGDGLSQFQLPLVVGETYDAVVDKGDGTFTTITSDVDPNALLNYSSDGIYIVKIYKKFGGWSFNNGGDKLKVTSVNKWGAVQFDYLIGGFFGCTNLTSIPFAPIGQIDHQTITSYQYLFRDTNIGITLDKMYFEYMSNATSLYGMFRNSNISGSIPSDLFQYTPNITLLGEFFHTTNVSGNIPSLLFQSLTNLTSLSFTFQDCPNLSTIPNDLLRFNISLLSVRSLFQGCTGITTIPTDMLRYNTNIVDVSRLFNGCVGLTGAIPDNMFFYNKLVTDYTFVFRECRNLVLPVIMFDLSVLNIVTSFDRFMHISSTSYSFTGTIQDIWNYATSAISTQAFFNQIALTNYASIPVSWK